MINLILNSIRFADDGFNSPVWLFIGILFMLGIVVWAIIIAVGSGVFIFSAAKQRQKNAKSGSKQVAPKLQSMTLNSSSPSTDKATNYVIGFAIDALMACAIVAVPAYLGYFNTSADGLGAMWDTESWHHVVLVTPLIIILIRVIERLLIKTTLGERIIKTPKITYKTAFKYIGVDIIAIAIIFLIIAHEFGQF